MPHIVWLAETRAHVESAGFYYLSSWSRLPQVWEYAFQDQVKALEAQAKDERVRPFNR